MFFKSCDVCQVPQADGASTTIFHTPRQELLEDRRLDGQGAEVLSKRTAGRYGIPASPPPVSTDAQTLYV